MLVVRLIFILFIIPFFTHAAVVINEMMYDLEGADTGREWVEIFNNVNESVDLTGWKFFEANTNHALTLIKGEIVVPLNGYAVIADNADKFLIDWPNFSGVLFDSSFSLSNTGESLVIRDNNLIDQDSVIYNSGWGANGDGKSLQKINSQWVAGSPTPGVQNTSTSTPDIDVEPTSDVGSGSQNWPTEPQIYANAGPDKTAVAGADVVFTGQALGLNKEPLENARYVWSFGDGGMAEGKSVRHVYKYPSEYIAVLNVSSGEYSTSDRAMAKIISNQLEIIEANQNYIKLHNGSNVELDISFWFLRAENSLFKFPLNTFIKTNKDLIIDSSISGLKTENQKAEILYPNGSLAYSYILISQPKINEQMTTTVESKPVEIKKAEVKIESFNLPTSTDQTASVITSTQSNSLGLKKWLMIILGIGIFSGIGFIFVRRH